MATPSPSRTQHLHVGTVVGQTDSAIQPGMPISALAMECRGHRRTISPGGHPLNSDEPALPVRTARPQDLAQRTHRCPHCGLHADRDIVSAALTACVELTDPDDPATARVDYRLAHALRAALASQQEWEGSVNRHQPPTPPDGVGSARTGSHPPAALLSKQHSPTPEQTRPTAWTSRDQSKTTSPQTDWRCMTPITGQLLD